jgi:tetratricopeptide (TPR) repeat protein
MAGKIFINYRRDDSISTAGRLHDRLAQTFGRKNLFMDVDHIPAGVDFVEYLQNQVAACDVFLVVIGPNWLDVKDDSGRRRFDNPDDFVTIEIAAALARNIRVIPVLVDGARTPKADKLPDSVKPLVRRNAIEVRNTQFGRDADALANKVREALKSARPVTRQWPFMASAAAWLMVPGRWRRVALSAAMLLLAWIGLHQIGVPVWVPWTPRAEHPDPPGADKAAPDAEAKRKAEEAEQQWLAAAKAEEDRKAKAAAEAEAKRKAEEAEQQRLAALKAEEDRKAKAAAEAEARAKAEQAEKERVAAAKAEEDRKAKAAAEAEAKRKAEEAEQQRLAALKAEEDRKAKAPADAEAQRKTEEAEQQRLAALNSKEALARGWLGVRFQQVTDQIAESLNISPPRGVLVAGVDDKGPVKAAGIELGDVIVKFDGKDIKEMRDLPRILADTPVGKQTPMVIIRQGKEETKTVTVGKLDVAVAAPAERYSALVKQSYTELNNGDYDKAIATASEAIRLDPKNASAFVGRGLAYAKKGDNDRAIADYNEAIGLDAKDANSLLNRGNAYQDKREYDRAIADYSEAIRLDPKFKIAFFHRGLAYGNKREHDRAIADYSEVIRLDAKDASSLINRGNAYQEKREYDLAIADYSEALRLDPKYISTHGMKLAFLNRGNAYQDKREYDRAIADYSEAIRLDPKFTIAFFRRGLAYGNKREHDRAIADYSEVIRLDPKDANSLINRGNAYQDKREYDLAIADYSEALRLDPKYINTYGMKLAFHNRGNAYQGKREYDRAIADYSEALRLDPQYALAFCSRGRVKKAKGDRTGGDADIKKAKQLNPSSCE